jgi:hypothetical protein
MIAPRALCVICSRTSLRAPLLRMDAVAGFTDALRLTPESFDYLKAPYADVASNQGLFLGDYVGLTSSGSDFLGLFSAVTDDDPADAVFVRVRGN